MSYRQSNKQDTLVSGTNIKTVNSQSLLGSGNISISGATLADGDYGDITVGGSGTTMTIDNLAVTNAKINDVDGSKVTQSASYRLVTDTEKATWNGKQNALTNPVTGTGTTNELTYWSGSGTVGTLATATYPSLTELSYVKGLTSSVQTQLNGKQATLTNPVTGTGTNNEIAAFNSTGSTITSLTTATYPSLTELSYVKGVTSAVQTQLNGKEPTITNGFGITGTTTKAVSLTNTQAFCTATTAISTATYADITGASITLAAGTWLIMATANVYAANTAFIAHIAITDGANTVIAEGSQGMPASGTASVNQWGNVSLNVIVSPAGSTTYKLRGARGNTTITGTYTVADGAGTGTTNNATDNTDKGTVIMAVRIA